MKEKLLRAIDEAREREAELEAFVVDEPANPDGRWNAKDHLAHTSWWRWRSARTLDATRTGGELPPPVPDDDGVQNAIIYAGRTPGQFACYAVLARHWIDTHPTQTTQERVVLVYAWTEIGEGGAIIPNHQDGYAYADALRTVFGTPDALPATPPYCA